MQYKLRPSVHQLVGWASNAITRYDIIWKECRGPERIGQKAGDSVGESPMGALDLAIRQARRDVLYVCLPRVLERDEAKGKSLQEPF